MTDAFTTREVAELADVSVRAIDKAVEENVLTGIRSVMSRGKLRRMLPLHAVPYAAIVKRLPMTHGRIEKRNLARVHIEENPDILGGTPVVKGTRLSVYAIRGRLDGGESIDAIVDDYPGVSREAVATALLYARTHPLVGRPGGRPWKKAA